MEVDQDRLLNIKLYAPPDTITRQSQLQLEATYSNRDKIKVSDEGYNQTDIQVSNEFEDKIHLKEDFKDKETIKKNNKTGIEQVTSLLGVTLVIVISGYILFRKINK